MLKPSPSPANIGALIVKIGFGAHYTIIILRNPQNGRGNYLGPSCTRPRQKRLGYQGPQQKQGCRPARIWGVKEYRLALGLFGLLFRASLTRGLLALMGLVKGLLLIDL